MSLELVIAQSARTDLLEVWTYIAEDNFDAADAMLARIQQTARLLSHQPGMGADRSVLSAGIRSFPIENYVLFYSFNDRTLTIRRVIHGRRDMDSIF